VYEPTLDAGRDRHVRINMIASVDGGTAVGNTSGGLGGAADHEVFATLRSFADVIVVGSATLLDEHYGPAQLDEAKRDARRERGQPPVPAIAVVTGTADFDWRRPFFAEAEVPPIILTVGTAPRPPADVASVIVAGAAGAVDFGVALDQLVERGYRNILVEGGPTINGEFAALGAVDEVCLTQSPMLVVGSSRRIFAGPDLAVPSPLSLASVVTADGYLFLRYRRAEPDPDA
jgi:riboflavin biosynthesis pyrimidine reductase